MKFFRYFISIFVLLNFSCKDPKENIPLQKGIRLDSLKHKVAYSKNLSDFIDNGCIKKAKQIWGYRFVISGDFDGDGIKETLTEHFISGVDRKECCKFYDSIDYDHLVGATIKKDPISFMLSNNKKIDTLQIMHSGQLLGVANMKNEGDLDGDGGDEVSYVVYWADWSSMNSCHIASFKKGKWEELYSFETRDWMLPGLPEVQNEYGLFGVEGINSTVGNDTLNQRLEKELRSFPGLIKKVGPNKIKVQTIIETEDSVVTVDLKNIKHEN